jgi:CDP-diacylglycerol--serine O-phosphatidyltransferase
MFSIPNILTSLNLICGSIAIIFVLQGRLDLACYLLFAAMIFDFADGFVARAMGISGKLGKQLDSLADMISFGLAPGVIVFVLLIISAATSLNGNLELVLIHPSMGHSVKQIIDDYFTCLLSGTENFSIAPFHGWTLILPFISLMIPFFSLFRLAKFNLDESQSDHFKGMPTPANTLFFMSIALCLWFGFKAPGYSYTLAKIFVGERLLTTLIVLFSVLLITEIPLLAFKFKNYSFTDNWEKYILLSTSLILLVVMGWFAFPFVILVYLVISVLKFYLSK